MGQINEVESEGPACELDSDPAQGLQEWRRGWLVVLCAGLGYGTGGALVQLMSGLFILPMRNDLGWSTKAVTIAPIVTLVWAFVSPFAGMAIDRMGSRRAAILGTLFLASCMLLLSVVPVTPYSLYGIAVLLGLATSLTVVATYTRGVATWFKHSMGLAIGLTMSGSAVVAIIALPITSTMIEKFGWQAGYATVAAIIALIGLPAILLGFRERQRDSAGKDPIPETTPAQVSGHSFREAVNDARFWLYMVAFGMACIPIGGFVGHLQPLLASQGFSPREAVTLGVLFSISVIVGRIVGGMLLDRCWPFGVAAGVLTLAAVGAVGLAYTTGSDPYILVGAAVLVIGLGQGAEADFLAFFCVQSFGTRAFSSIVGAFGMVGGLGVSAGAFGFGAAADLWGNYSIACHLAAVLMVCASLLLLVAGFRDASMRSAEKESSRLHAAKISARRGLRADKAGYSVRLSG